MAGHRGGDGPGPSERDTRRVADSRRAGREDVAHPSAEGRAARKDATIADLLRLAGAIGQAADETPDDPKLADRLLHLVVDGLRAQPRTGKRAR
ncbi:hypothetical protein AB0F91_19985 [Amycolatopsis sp. NPDC023774]|uniref:SbtR family transcriptional regulator n=1 Tax=Amycolatopsis sp. NPDC023774 TaxID=3155015 RepID=UPI003406EC3B